MKAMISTLLSAALLFGAPPDDPPQGNVDVDQKGRTTTANLAVQDKIVISGNGVGRGRGDSYRLPSPCWYEPSATAQEMYDRFTDPRENARRSAINEESRREFLKQFEEKLGQPGHWWVPNYDQNHPDGPACWGGLELFVFVPPDTTPPAGITPEQLTQIARASLTVPEHTIKLSPENRSFVNLDTWVWLEGVGETRRTVTATIPGFMSVTVVATLKSITIDPGTTDDRAETHDENCGPSGRPYTKGGTFTCGVRYLRASIDQPGEKYTLGVSTVWPVEVEGDVTELQLAPVTVETTRDIEIGEIQSNVRP
ncbi:enoyl reductase [Nonomuraea maritima]|uniref:Enoyl reductase n=2 Tax=Nonomuraea maritima TaxID=683260 RepID=A0A1G9ABC8_9ACTN|nr:enoyl reductase [Nonomuraea maritima]